MNSDASDSDQTQGLTYAKSGVDIHEADRLVDRIKGLAAKTARPGVMGGIGGFASLFSLKDALKDLPSMEDPLLVSGTDGVGTKLLVAIQAGRHDTVGIDLVAMCVNDILTTGARPLFFLDYFATGKLDANAAEAVVRGIAEGCQRAEVALVGGETAELPGLYQSGEYDLAGFAVGVVDRAQLVDGQKARAGDVVLGVSSHGIHSNGLSLARKALLEAGGLALTDPLQAGRDESVQDALLRPTALYTKTINALKAAVEVRAMAHITGGGIPGNLPRVLPRGVRAVFDRKSFTPPPIFSRIAELGRVAEAEMFSTFNMGLGLLVVVPQDQASAALQAVSFAGERAAIVAKLEADPDAAPSVDLGL